MLSLSTSAAAVVQVLRRDHIVVKARTAKFELHRRIVFRVEELNAKFAHADLEEAVAGDLSCTVKSVVVNNQLIVNVDSGAVVTHSANGPSTSVWNIYPPSVDHTEVIPLAVIGARTHIPVDIVFEEDLA